MQVRVVPCSFSSPIPHMTNILGLGSMNIPVFLGEDLGQLTYLHRRPLCNNFKEKNVPSTDTVTTTSKLYTNNIVLNIQFISV